MSDRRYIVLLNDALKGHVASASERERRRLREKFEFLENGLWDAGVRVKKLRGSGKLVFEARLSRGDRLLFTLGRHRGAVAVYVWGLVSHDDISAAARRIVPANAPFLDFEELGHEQWSELAIDSLPGSYLTQEDVEERVPEDHGPQRWLVLDEAEWKRLLASPDPGSYEAFLFLTREQEELLAASPPILLSGTAGSGKTTLSVYYLLKGAAADGRRLFLTYNPLLRQLAERIYAGLVEKRATGVPGGETRFAVFREMLREIAGAEAASFPPEREVELAQFAEIFADHRDRRRFDPELVWEEIRAIIKGAKLPLDPSRCAAIVERVRTGAASVAERRELAEYLLGLRDLSVARKVESFLERRTPFNGLDELAASTGQDSAESRQARDEALARVADVVAAAAADFSRPLLSLEEYLAVGRKRAPAFQHDRRAIHEIAAFYQERLERSARWDEIDLTRAALGRLSAGGEPPGWDLVVCDEVQDLTDIQIALLFRLASSPRAMVLTGDPRQILNPTGFRWEEVKYRFRERGLPVPEVRRLSLNFRCAGPIVRLANALLDLKQALVGLADTEMRESWKFGGRPPVVLEGMGEHEVVQLLGRRAAGQAVLTRSAEEARRMRQRLGTELVFSIAEAKGLEFETAFLWRYAADAGAEAIWRTIASGERPPEERLPHVRHELALLYVAVTRARGALLAWDGEKPSTVWEVGSLAPLVFRTGERIPLEELWKAASTPREWEAQAEYLLERGQLAAARECFHNAGNEARARLADALLLERDGRHAEAAPLFEQAGERERAAACYERSRAWDRAAALWVSLGEQGRARRADLRAAEERGQWDRAAEGWTELGEPELARNAWRKAGAWDRLAAAALQTGDAGEAAELFERARKPREAAAAWERAGQMERAADLYLRLGDHRSAAKLYRRAGNEEKLLRCLRSMGDHRGAALLLEKRGAVEEAIEAFAAWAAESEDARARLSDEVPEVKTRRTALKAGVRLAALGQDAEAAPLLLRAGIVDSAARRFEKTGDFAGVARCRELEGRWLEAVRAVERSSLEPRRRVSESQRLLYRHLKEAERLGRIEREVTSLHAEARRMIASGDPAPALARLRLIRDDDLATEAFRALGWHEDALEFFLDAGEVGAARRYAGSMASPVRLAFFDRQVERHPDRLRSAGEHDETADLLLELLAGAVAELEPAERGARVERYLFEAGGRFLTESMLSDSALELMLATRACNAICSLVVTSRHTRARYSKRMKAFVARLAAEAKESGDPRLAACHALATDRQAFEDAAAALPLREDTVWLVGSSSARYREAVDFLMAAGRLEEARHFGEARAGQGELFG